MIEYWFSLDLEDFENRTKSYTTYIFILFSTFLLQYRPELVLRPGLILFSLQI